MPALIYHQQVSCALSAVLIAFDCVAVKLKTKRHFMYVAEPDETVSMRPGHLCHTAGRLN